MRPLQTTTVLGALLRPIVRFCFRHSLKVQDAYATLKREFVREAEREIVQRGEEITLSRVSVMTGIPRKFIREISESGDLPEETGNLIMKVIGTWQNDPRYCTPNRKRPRALHCEGNDSEFAELVRSVSVDLNPYTVLNELERVELVKRSGDTIKLLSPYYLERDFNRAFEIGSRDSDALYNVIEHNLRSKEDPHLHLFTEYDNIPDAALEEIRGWLLKEGYQFQEKVSDYLSRFDRDSSAGELNAHGQNTVRVVLYEFTHESLAQR